MPQSPKNAPTVSTPMQLEVRDRDGSAIALPLTKDRMIIGRSSKADLRLDNETVSRQHAELLRDPFGRWWVRDLGSRNGMKVNGTVIKDSLLSENDHIEIGDFALTLRTDHGGVKPGDLAPAVNDAPDTHISVFDQNQTARIDTLHLTTLQEFGHRLQRLEDAGERLRTLCRLMVRNDFHGLGAVALRLLKDQPQHPPQVLVEPTAVPRLGDWRPYVSRGLLAAVRQSESPVMASTSPKESGAIEMSISPDSDRDMAQAAIACPLHVDAKRMDVLYVTLPAQYGTAEWMALVALACQQYQQAETTIHAATQAKAHAAIEKELERAREIQMRLLPAGLAVEGLDIALGFEPCRWVGGDYADAVKLKDGRVLLVVADVCGKGLSASLVSASLHTMIHTLTATGLSLVQTLASVNEYLCEYLDDRSFVTLAAVLIDPRTGELEMVNAGHMAPVILSPGGGHRSLEEAVNLPLRVERGQAMELQKAQLGRGDLLMLYTDGLTELRDEAGKMLGTKRLCGELCDIYRARAGESAQQISTSLRAMLDGVQGDRVPLDDRTYVLAKRA